MFNIVVMAIARLLIIVLIAIVTILIWKTTEYFNGLQMNDKNRPLISCDVVMLFIMLINMIIKLITM